MFSLTVFIILYFTQTFCDPPQTNLFMVYACNDQEIQPIHYLGSFMEIKTSQLLCCAYSCNIDNRCKYAVYRYASESCAYIDAVTANTIPSKNSLLIGEEGCHVLVKDNDQGSHPMDVHLDFNDRSAKSALWESMTPDEFFSQHKNMKDTKHVLKIFWTNHQAIHIDSIICQEFGSDGFFCSAPRTIAFFLNDKRFPFPSYFEDKVFVPMKLDLMIVEENVSEGEKRGFRNEMYQNGSLVVRKVQTDEHILVYGRKELKIGTLDSLMSAVSQGFRRAENHPIWMKLDRDRGDVTFEMIKIFTAESGEGTTPDFNFYYSSVKESAATGIRHTFRYMLHRNESHVDFEEVKTPPYWEMEKYWRKLLLTDDSTPEEAFSVLKNAAESGLEMRVVIDGSISSDIAFVKVRNDYVSCQLANHIAPLRQGKKLGDSKVKLLISTVSTSKRLFECTMALQAGTIFKYKSEHLTGLSFDWYVSNRNWTMMLKTENGKVMSGSIDSLYEGAAEGKNVRVCHLMSSVNRQCFGAAKVWLKSRDHIVIQSPPHLFNDEIDRLKTHTEENIKKIPCTHSVTVISTKGWVRRLIYLPGTTRKTTWKSTSMTQQHWFIEM